MGSALLGKPVVEFLRDNIKKEVSILGEKGVTPTILIIRVGEREDDISYERGILKNCGLLGIGSIVKCLPVGITLDELVNIIKEANEDKNIHGIMLFRPLPVHLDTDVLGRTISPLKDIDSMSPINLEKVFEGKKEGFAPCTAKAIIEVLKFYDIPLKGANVAVAGRSLVVGKPLAMLLLDENATVTICHSKTKNMPSITSKADIVVAAIGKARFMGEEYFSSESVVIDVGINNSDDGKICGDVDYDRVIDNVKALTPAIGGVGTITTTILLGNVVKACQNLFDV
jgi:5,10-methylene-tetrahydrofolate dehydrogenase/Methenyl tetrahydrofolate cyclohydrolase